MMKKLLARTRQEDGNMFILFLGTLLLMVAFVGLAIDTAGSINARQATNNTLSSATVAGASQTNPNGTIHSNRARATAIELYSQNRQNISMMRCATAADVPAGGQLVGPSSCPFVLTDFTVRSGSENAARSGGRITTASVTMSVRECSPNFFMHMVQDELCFNVTSTGRLSTSVEG